ncbi:MAG TPA: ACT domain-containing protein [Flavisolibacter sp.]|nr:ACT domain-containing protein [Flavisolibacter sp.]
MLTSPKRYKKDLQAVIAASWFTVDEAVYVYASVTAVPEPEKHLLVVRDGAEITVATDEKHLPLPNCRQVNDEQWRLVNIRCGNPFYCVGFIASITDALATAGIDIVIISSFSNDLILVMQQDLERAVNVLVGIGFRQDGQGT